MTLKSHTFLRGGVHPVQDYKYLTAAKAIHRFTPAEVVIPLAQHLGRPATPLVQRKAVVTRGQKIAEAGPDGAPIHASISGVVKRVALSPHPTLVESQAIVIGVDPNAAEVTWTEVSNWRNLSKDEMIAAIQDAGIVGLGGAAFPTHRTRSASGR
jgi:electron transport complex protein RnfC